MDEARNVFKLPNRTPEFSARNHCEEKTFKAMPSVILATKKSLREASQSANSSCSSQRSNTGRNVCQVQVQPNPPNTEQPLQVLSGKCHLSADDIDEVTPAEAEHRSSPSRSRMKTAKRKLDVESEANHERGGPRRKEGRKNQAVQYKEQNRPRQVSFLKRKNGLLKKGHELSVLTGCKVGIIIFNNDNGKLYEYFSDPSGDVLQMYAECSGPSELRLIKTMEDEDRHLVRPTGDATNSASAPRMPGPPAPAQENELESENPRLFGANCGIQPPPATILNEEGFVCHPSIREADLNCIPEPEGQIAVGPCRTRASAKPQVTTATKAPAVILPRKSYPLAKTPASGSLNEHVLVSLQQRQDFANAPARAALCSAQALGNFSNSSQEYRSRSQYEQKLPMPPPVAQYGDDPVGSDHLAVLASEPASEKGVFGAFVSPQFLELPTNVPEDSFAYNGPPQSDIGLTELENVVVGAGDIPPCTPVSASTNSSAVEGTTLAAGAFRYSQFTTPALLPQNRASLHAEELPVPEHTSVADSWFPF